MHMLHVRGNAHGAQEAEGAETQWVLDHVVAGATIDGLTVQLLDGAGGPVPRPVEGRVRASWSTSEERVRLAHDGIFDLPPLKARSRAACCKWAPRRPLVAQCCSSGVHSAHAQGAPHCAPA